MNHHIRILVDGKPVKGKVVAIEASQESMELLAKHLQLKADFPDGVFVRLIGHAPYGIDTVVPGFEADSLINLVFDPPYGGKVDEATESPVPENDGHG